MARRYEFYVRVARTISILFLPRGHKIHIFEPTCNVLFIIWRLNIKQKQRAGIVTSLNDTIPGPFYEAQFGVEIFVELYTLRFDHQSPPKCCKDTLPFYFINFSVVVYCYYGYLPIS